VVGSEMTAHDYNLSNTTIVPLDRLKRFLKLNNWHIKIGSSGDVLIYESNLDDWGRPITLALPVSSEFDDTPEMIAKALNLLAAMQNKPVRLLREEINNLSKDGDNCLGNGAG
jgi:hypothetical protein